MFAKRDVFIVVAAYVVVMGLFTLVMSGCGGDASDGPVIAWQCPCTYAGTYSYIIDGSDGKPGAEQNYVCSPDQDGAASMNTPGVALSRASHAWGSAAASRATRCMPLHVPGQGARPRKAQTSWGM